MTTASCRFFALRRSLDSIPVNPQLQPLADPETGDQLQPLTWFEF
jgi:hypothetical protein